jgi:hypothetical protein
MQTALFYDSLSFSVRKYQIVVVADMMQQKEAHQHA